MLIKYPPAPSPPPPIPPPPPSQWWVPARYEGLFLYGARSASIKCLQRRWAGGRRDEPTDGSPCSSSAVEYIGNLTNGRLEAGSRRCGEEAGCRDQVVQSASSFLPSTATRHGGVF